MGQEQEKSVTRSVALDTIRAYNEYLLDVEKVKVAGRRSGSRESHVAMAKNRRAAGVATDLEVLRLQVALENQRVRV